jgi:hypothetical protein
MPAAGKGALAPALAAIGLAIAIVGCKKQGARTATPDAAIASPEGAADPLASLERELDDVDARMEQAGLETGNRDVRKTESPASPAGDTVTKQQKPPREPPKQTESGDDVAPRCQPLCELAATSCDLQTRVCELADEHEGEPRYEEACVRAQDQCRVATEACTACNGAG